jgi:hypothetical protein
MRILSWDIGQKNLALCHFDDDNIIDWQVIDLTTNFKSKIKQKDLTLLSQTIYNILEKEHKWLDSDFVLIENQPTKNPVMKTIQMIIFGFYQYKKFQNLFKGEINLFNPRVKLKYQTDCPTEQELGYKRTVKDDYSHRKKLSICMTKHYLIKNKSNWENDFLKHKKKDDLADCYLQARAYWLKNNKSFVRRQQQQQQQEQAKQKKNLLSYEYQKVMELNYVI